MYKGTKLAGYNSAGTDIQGGGGGVWQTPATTKNQQAGNRIALKKKKKKKRAKKIGGGNLAGFCKSPEMGTKFAYIRFFLYLCSGKEKNGQVGVAEVKDSRVMCL